EIVRVFANFPRELLISSEKIALWISDFCIDLRNPLLVAQRKKPKKNQWQNITLIVSRFDASTQRNRSIPKLLEQIRTAGAFLVNFLRLRLHFARRNLSRNFFR